MKEISYFDKDAYIGRNKNINKKIQLIEHKNI